MNARTAFIEAAYLAASIRVWRHGHFLSFSGLTQLSAVYLAVIFSALLLEFGQVLILGFLIFNRIDLDDNPPVGC